MTPPSQYPRAPVSHTPASNCPQRVGVMREDPKQVPWPCRGQLPDCLPLPTRLLSFPRWAPGLGPLTCLSPALPAPPVCCPFLHSCQPPLRLLRDPEMSLWAGTELGPSSSDLRLNCQTFARAGGAWSPPPSPSLRVFPGGRAPPPLFPDPCSPTAADPPLGSPWVQPGLLQGRLEWPPRH